LKDVANVTCLHANDRHSYSREDLEIDRLLQLACIFYELDHLLLALQVRSHFSDVLTKDVSAGFSEDTPQVLDKWLTEEYKTLF